MPAALTSAMAGFDDSQVASAVTDRLEVSASAAVAVNGVVAPIAGGVPVTVTALTVVLGVVDGVEGADGEATAGGVGEEESLHAAENATKATSSSSR